MSRDPFDIDINGILDNAQEPASGSACAGHVDIGDQLDQMFGGPQEEPTKVSEQDIEVFELLEEMIEGFEPF